jgi:hypothetical protein
MLESKKEFEIHVKATVELEREKNNKINTYEKGLLEEESHKTFFLFCCSYPLTLQCNFLFSSHHSTEKKVQGKEQAKKGNKCLQHNYSLPLETYARS